MKHAYPTLVANLAAAIARNDPEAAFAVLKGVVAYLIQATADHPAGVALGLTEYDAAVSGLRVAVVRHLDEAHRRQIGTPASAVGPGPLKAIPPSLANAMAAFVDVVGRILTEVRTPAAADERVDVPA